MEQTKIKNLVAGQKNVWIAEAEIIECSEPKEINIKGKPVKVVDAVIRDESGSIRISAFDFASKFLLNAKKVEIQNCFCKLYGGENKKDGELQISTGLYGRLRVIERKNG